MKIAYIRSRRGAFAKDGTPALKCHPDGHIQANTFGEAHQWEQWTVHPVNHEDTIALKSWTGKFLSAKPHSEGFDVRADADSIGEWEVWKIIPRGDAFVALQSYHGKYLVCDDFFKCGNLVKADREDIAEWEEWAIGDHPWAFTNPGHTTKLAIGGSLIAAGSILTMGTLAIPLAGFGVGGVVAGSTAVVLDIT